MPAGVKGSAWVVMAGGGVMRMPALNVQRHGTASEWVEALPDRGRPDTLCVVLCSAVARCLEGPL